MDRVNALGARIACRSVRRRTAHGTAGRCDIMVEPALAARLDALIVPACYSARCAPRRTTCRRLTQRGADTWRRLRHA
jgi:hypothetical protein